MRGQHCFAIHDSFEEDTTSRVSAGGVTFVTGSNELTKPRKHREYKGNRRGGANAKRLYNEVPHDLIQDVGFSEIARKITWHDAQDQMARTINLKHYAARLL